MKINNTECLSKKILNDIRNNIGEKKSKEDQDKIINSSTSGELFNRWCEWHGFIGWSEKIMRAVFEIYGVE